MDNTQLKLPLEKKYSRADIDELLKQIRQYSVTVVVLGEQGTPEFESQVINQAIQDAVDYGEEWFNETHG